MTLHGSLGRSSRQPRIPCMTPWLRIIVVAGPLKWKTADSSDFMISHSINSLLKLSTAFPLVWSSTNLLLLFYSFLNICLISTVPGHNFSKYKAIKCKAVLAGRHWDRFSSGVMQCSTISINEAKPVYTQWKIGPHGLPLKESKNKTGIRSRYIEEVWNSSELFSPEKWKLDSDVPSCMNVKSEREKINV